MSKESMKFEPMETLLPEDVTVGSIVLYQSPDERDRVWPAIVNMILQDGVVNLHVFCDYGVGRDVPTVCAVKYDVTGQPGTWRWEL